MKQNICRENFFVEGIMYEIVVTKNFWIYSISKTTRMGLNLRYSFVDIMFSYSN